MSPKKAPVKVVVDPILALKEKFAEIKEIRKKLVEVKALYQRHDQLVAELLPYFVEVTPDKFILKREFIIGSDKFRLVPYFFDEKKGCILPVVWKSSAHRTLTIE
jgi:hypothetical protein